MRDYDDELLSTARIKQGADDRILRRIDSGLNAAKMVYGLAAAIVGLAIWLTTLRSDVTRLEKEQDKLRELLNQVYEREFGVKISFR
jgi:hypothetical protein